MVRKTKEEAARTRQQLLDAALDVFSEKGFSGTSLQEIAERAGFTRGAVYWHFANKVDLLVAMVEDIEHEAEAAGVPSVESVDDLAEVLSTYLRRFVEDERYGRFYRTMMVRTPWTDEVQPVIDWYEKDQAEFMGWLEQVMARFQAAGLVTGDRPAALLACGINALITGLVTTWVFDPGALDMVSRAPDVLADYLERLRP